MAEENVLIGRSKRSVERKVFGNAMRISMGNDADAATKRIVRAYAKAWNSISGVAGDLADMAAEARHDGRRPSPREIARMDRVDRAMFALERQIRELGKFTSVTVTGGATHGIGRVVSNVLDELPSLTGVDRRFTKPSGAAMEGLILRSTERIESSTRRLTAEQSGALKAGLFRGLVLGENPKTTARAILTETEGAFFGGLARATTIARTEIADAHRYATRLAYNEEELVVGWKWLAQLSARTCPACWSMHNTFHEKSEVQFAHQNCRCTMVPVLADDLPADIDLGDPEELFWGLPREQQLAIMGPGRLKALEGGAPWSSLSFLKHSAEWRPSRQVTSVADLTGLAELHIAHTPGDIITIPGQTNRTIMDAAFRQGGMTIHTLTGEQPTSGFAVARQGTSAVIDAREFFGPSGPLVVSDWMIQHGDRLDTPGAHMGMWYDTANGKVVLDVVEILDDKDAAIALGRSEDQIAIFDLGTFTEISTGGTGGYADPITNALRPDGVTTGKTVTVMVDGTEMTGRVTETPGYSDVTIIQTPDGQTVRAWPDQILRVHDGGDQQAEVDRIKALGELARQVQQDTGIARVSFNGMTLDDARRAADTIRELAADYEGVLPSALDVGPADGAMAVTSTGFPGGKADSTITVAADYVAKPDLWRSDMTDAETRGHFHRGTADDRVDYTLDHEFGHVLDNALWGDPRTVSGERTRRQIGADVHNALLADQIREGLVEPATPFNIEQAWQGVPAMVERDLSGYAASSPAEMFAEAFAVYRDHGPGESIVADTVMKHYVRAYREKFGHWPHERDLETLLPGEYQSPEQGALFSERIGRPVGLSEAKAGLRVTVNGRFGRIESMDGSHARVRFEDDGTVETVFGGDLRHALRKG